MGQTFKNTSSDGIFKSNISIISTASSLRIGSPAMIDVTKELPQKTIVVQLTYGAVFKSCNDSAIWRQSLISASGACLRQHLGHIVSNGQQSAVLHASVMPFFLTMPIT